MSLNPKSSKVDFRNLVEEIKREAAASTATAYAPPEVRNRDDHQMLIKQVEKFGSLPTQELDDMISGLEAEIAKAKSDAQKIRDVYMKYTTQLTERIRRLQDRVKVSLDTLKTLHEQSSQLQVDEPEPEPAEIPLLPMRREQ